MADRIQIRRDTAANWTSVDPTLAQGELGVETDTNKFKVGDGSTAWSSIDYLIDASSYGYLNIPPVGTKTGSYTLATGDVGKYVQLGVGGSITIPDATFSEGDVVSLFNNTAGDITITCSVTTAYIAGDDTDVASMTLASRGVATVLFISGTVAVISGNVS